MKGNILFLTKAKYNLGPLDAAEFLGSVTALTDNLAGAVASGAGAWYYVDGVSGAMTGSNPPADDVVAAGYIISDGAAWQVFPQIPTIVPDGSLTRAKLDAATNARLTLPNSAEVETLGVVDPEGSYAAPAGTMGVATDGSLWYKATGTGDAGWSQITAELIIDGGAF